MLPLVPTFPRNPLLLLADSDPTQPCATAFQVRVTGGPPTGAEVALAVSCAVGVAATTLTVAATCVVLLPDPQVMAKEYMPSPSVKVTTPVTGERSMSFCDVNNVPAQPSPAPPPL